ncbi:metalloregulator ArsR/SmtB family transcription factor [Aminiphilus sp.]|uniref:ArsR/SmtB family transcription factor n=1 Tax=Aminiphilus sp. TaxID=1872488 RepID=UPI002613C6BE|nr:metalloregulator ArsR/SmtB family transcription factor [Aminiphilus sp.]
MDRQRKKADIFKGLSHPVRLAIVELLSEGERCVCDIAGAFSCDRTTISKHLSILRMLDIIEDRREGLNVFYRMRMRCLTAILSCVDALTGENVSEGVSCPLLERNRHVSPCSGKMPEETVFGGVPRKSCEGKSGQKGREGLRS